MGWPVSHSLSPRMHNAAFASLGLDWAYVPLPVAPEWIDEAVRGLAALGFAGANVTVPHKQAVIPFLDELTPIARAIGAVNTIVVRPDGSLLGDSTDGAGFMADLRAHGVRIGESANRQISALAPERSAGASVNESANQRISESANRQVIESSIEDRRVAASPCPPASVSPCRLVTVSPCHPILVIGAGGAARAVVYALAEAGATIAVVNRTLDRAQGLCQTIGAALPQAADRLTAHRFPEALSELAAEAELIVNTTSLGLHEGDPLPWDASIAFRPDQIVYDLVYNRPTGLLALTSAYGARAIDGLGMLVRQGALAFELWTGVTAPVDVMFEAVREA